MVLYNIFTLSLHYIQIGDWKGLVLNIWSFATAAGPAQDQKMHLGCGAYTKHPMNSLATVKPAFLNSFGGSTHTAAAHRRAVPRMKDAE